MATEIVCRRSFLAALLPKRAPGGRMYEVRRRASGALATELAAGGKLLCVPRSLGEQHSTTHTHHPTRQSCCLCGTVSWTAFLSSCQCEAGGGTTKKPFCFCVLSFCLSRLSKVRKVF